MRPLAPLLALALVSLAPFAGTSIATTAVAQAQTETGKFLGPERDWTRVRIELKDVHALSGGHDVAIEGSGRAVVQVVQQDRTEYRFFLPLDRAEALALVKLVCDQDLLAQKPKERMGVPDEARPTIVVRNALGTTRTISKWANDALPPFDKVQAALAALVKRTEGRKVDATLRHDPSWRPFEGITATISMFSGRPDPTFELTAPEDVEKVKALVLDLPGTVRPQEGAPALGYRGILLNPREIPGLPAWISVHKGTIQMGDSPDTFVYKKDAKGLEAWLKAEARKRGIEILER